ncbi:DUF2959 domain-containing protein [Thalassotalea sp. Y01]|uniref:DUF2959 domain-containing protein n=1 Tax=Thalassotalea sp. Y01 TaxID=2729613 RepID=UPI00145E9929|nr:DUF2959 domain-containing protein [Thalassotalea sp. Y01]NMP15274.1 DUF2959 domain-containing protein [Thalassotalea sp. Y01]
MVFVRQLCLIGLLLTLAGCQSAYYSAMESVGTHKRDIMVDRVEGAKESQRDAQEQFKSALEQLSELIDFEGGDLQQQYEITLENYEDSQDAADDVSDRIDSIEDVSEALFDEWQDEIGQYSSKNLQRQSQAKLTETQRNYDKLMKTMRRAEKSMQPVLAALKDNMLYLKHNLNAKAVGQLQGEYASIKADVDVLIEHMNDSIMQSQTFINQIENQ